VPDDFTMFREFTQERMMYVHRLFVLRFDSLLTAAFNLENKIFFCQCLAGEIGKIFTRIDMVICPKPPDTLQHNRRSSKAMPMVFST